MSKPHFNTGSKLWHKWDDKSKKFVCRRQPNGAIPPAGSGWLPGFAPKDPQERERLSELMSKKFTGRKMTPEWKEAMSKASKGKPKSKEHKEAMSRGQQARLNRSKPIQEAIDNNDIESLKVLLLARKDKNEKP